MSALRQAAKQALEALEGKRYTACGWRSDCDKAITALRAALAEPQTWVCPDSAEHRYGKPGHCEDCGNTLVQVAGPTTEDSSEVEPFIDGYPLWSGIPPKAP